MTFFETEEPAKPAPAVLPKPQPGAPREFTDEELKLAAKQMQRKAAAKRAQNRAARLQAGGSEQNSNAAN